MGTNGGEAMKMLSDNVHHIDDTWAIDPLTVRGELT